MSRWSLDVLNAVSSSVCSKSRLWNLKYENLRYENGRRVRGARLSAQESFFFGGVFSEGGGLQGLGSYGGYLVSG